MTNTRKQNHSDEMELLNQGFTTSHTKFHPTKKMEGVVEQAQEEVKKAFESQQEEYIPQHIPVDIRSSGVLGDNNTKTLELMSFVRKADRSALLEIAKYYNDPYVLSRLIQHSNMECCLIVVARLNEIHDKFGILVKQKGGEPFGWREGIYSLYFDRLIGVIDREIELAKQDDTAHDIGTGKLVKIETKNIFFGNSISENQVNDLEGLFKKQVDNLRNKGYNYPVKGYQELG